MIMLADDGSPSCQDAPERRCQGDPRRATNEASDYDKARDGMWYLLGCLFVTCTAALVCTGTVCVILRLVRWALAW